MANTPNVIDYSNLNKSLQPKRKIDNVKEDVAKAIWEVFLQSNNLKIEEGMNAGRIKRRNDRINEFANKTAEASEWAKSEFVLTVNYLLENNLMTTEKIKSLNLKSLNNDEITPDKKLSNILDELTKWLKEPDKLKLNQHVSKWLLNLSKEANNADKLWERITDLEQQNSDLKGELDALDAVNEVSERAVLTRRSMNNMIRVWNSIKNINDSSLDPITKARKVLWQANSFAIFGSWKRFDWVYNKLPLKFDLNKEYKDTVDKLKEKMDKSSNDGEKVAIRYIMKHVNKSYEDYIKATTISDNERKSNMRQINEKMVKAA